MSFLSRAACTETMGGERLCNVGGIKRRVGRSEVCETEWARLCWRWAGPDL